MPGVMANTCPIHEGGKVINHKSATTDPCTESKKPKKLCPDTTSAHNRGR
jgi:hypothetical protein